MNEPVKYATLQVTNLKEEGAQVTDTYRNMLINQVNGSCLRLAVFEGEYRWHYHPSSDELFIVVEGCLAIDLEDAGVATTTLGECDHPGERLSTARAHDVSARLADALRAD
jgi:mannose-6-phosphate isomerase-like protein (cupin superfamily)